MTRSFRSASGSSRTIPESMASDASFLGLDADGWQLTGTWVAAAVALIALAAAIHELRQAKKRHQLDRTLALVNQVLSAESVRAMIQASLIREELEKKPLHLRFALFQDMKRQGVEQRERRGQVMFMLNLFEQIALAYHGGMLEKNLVRRVFESQLIAKHNRWSWLIDELEIGARTHGARGDQLPFAHLRRLAREWEAQGKQESS